MANEVLEEKSIGYLLKAVTHLVKLPKTHMWLDYDSEADVLYIHFDEKPGSTPVANGGEAPRSRRRGEAAFHSEMRDDGIILDYRGSRLVGLTILEASHR